MLGSRVCPGFLRLRDPAVLVTGDFMVVPRRMTPIQTESEMGVKVAEEGIPALWVGVPDRQRRRHTARLQVHWNPHAHWV